MLVVTHCQTCGEPVGHLYPLYLELVSKYATEQKVDLNPDSEDGDEGKEGRSARRPSPEFLARQDLIDKHGLDGRRECCLYALFVNYDITDIVN
jgi:DNA-directed RNA polymerase subunit N (RpoN/RPB10)